MKKMKFFVRCGVILLFLFSMLCQRIAAVGTFTMSDTQAPSAPKDLAVYSETYTSAILTWKPSTDNIGVKGYELYCNSKKIASTSTASYEYKKLTPGAAYKFYVKAYDNAGNYSAQSNSITVHTLSDSSAPSVPSGLKVSSVSVTETSLTWSPSSDNVSVKGYVIMRDGIKIADTSKTSYTSKGLVPGKTYTYAIRAFDIPGNLSDPSRLLSVTTPMDSQAPAAPGDLKITATEGASVTLEWKASTDNSKIAGYQIYCNGIVITTAAGTSRTVKSPFCMGTDVYWIKAYDIAGNLSANSNSVTAVIPYE